MYREDGKLAARGRHVKHLPMGRAWDLSTIPFVFPYARKLSERQHAQWLRDPERSKVKVEAARNVVARRDSERKPGLCGSPDGKTSSGQGPVLAVGTEKC